MRKFEVTFSKHRPDGCITLWISAVRKFSVREMEAKLGLIRELVSASIFPLCRFIYCFQAGQTIYDSNEFEVIFEKERFIEFVLLDATDVDILLDFLRNAWGGQWTIEFCEWDNPFNLT